MAGTTAPTRPNRNMLWLIGLAIAAILVVILAMNSKSTIQSGSQRVGEEAAPAGAPPSTGTPATSGGAAGPG